MLGNDVTRVLRRLLPALLVGGLLAAVALAAQVSDPQVTQVPMPTFTPPVQTEQAEQDGPTIPPAPTAGTAAEQPGAGGAEFPFLEIMGWVLLVVLVALASWFIVRRTTVGRRRRVRMRSDARVAAEPAEPEEIRAAVEAGIDELEEDAADPRQAVIACWVRLERAAAAAGTPREPGDTPGDLVTTMLAAHHVSGSLLHRLAAVYRRARYAPDDVDESMRTEAHTALSQLRTELDTRLAEAAQSESPAGPSDRAQGTTGAE